MSSKFHLWSHDRIGHTPKQNTHTLVTYWLIFSFHVFMFHSNCQHRVWCLPCPNCYILTVCVFIWLLIYNVHHHHRSNVYLRDGRVKHGDTKGGHQWNWTYTHTHIESTQKTLLSLYWFAYKLCRYLSICCASIFVSSCLNFLLSSPFFSIIYCQSIRS